MCADPDLVVQQSSGGDPDPRIPIFVVSSKIWKGKNIIITSFYEVIYLNNNTKSYSFSEKVPRNFSCHCAMWLCMSLVIYISLYASYGLCSCSDTTVFWILVIGLFVLVIVLLMVLIVLLVLLLFLTLKLVLGLFWAFI